MHKIVRTGTKIFLYYVMIGLILSGSIAIIFGYFSKSAEQEMDKKIRKDGKLEGGKIEGGKMILNMSYIFAIVCFIVAFLIWLLGIRKI